MKTSKYKFIYNPHSGKKRRLFIHKQEISLEEVKALLSQYQIETDYFPTKYPNHAKKLAKEAVKEGYTHVIVAGGDGTIGEAANGLVGTDITLGIIPFGSFMNIARMLAIPSDAEKAIELIKIGRTRKIDIGAVVQIKDKKQEEPYYFIESIGVGLWAELHQYIDLMEKGKLRAILPFIHSIFGYYLHAAKITVDTKLIETKALLISVSNGPYSAAALKLAPEAKLNDHVLTLSIYKMSKLELLGHFYTLFRFGKNWKRKVDTYQGKEIQIESKVQRLIHVDGRIFGKTPATLTIVPSALTVITGFPPSTEESAFRKRTYLDN